MVRRACQVREEPSLFEKYKYVDKRKALDKIITVISIDYSMIDSSLAISAR